MRRLTALDDVLPLLRCPHCEAALSREGEAVRCEAGHSFDVARQGYLSLLGREGTPHTGDTERALDAGTGFDIHPGWRVNARIAGCSACSGGIHWMAPPSSNQEAAAAGMPKFAADQALTNVAVCT